jgi:hypothetical protein
MRLVLSWLLQVALLAAASQLVCVHAQTMMGKVVLRPTTSTKPYTLCLHLTVPAMTGPVPPPQARCSSMNS